MNFEITEKPLANEFQLPGLLENPTFNLQITNFLSSIRFCLKFQDLL